jgi:DNA-binding NarL/FixJ family response regulator
VPAATDRDCKIGVLNKSRYRADALAFAITEQSGHEALAITQADLGALGRFTTILVDLDGEIEIALRLTRTLTKLQPPVRVILLGFAESEESAVKIAEAGASGYVSPTASLQELTAVLLSVQKDEFACPPDITYALFSRLAQLAQTSDAGVLPTRVLTARERQVTRLMSLNLGNKEIAYRLGLSQHTVKNHVHRILKKLGVSNRRIARLTNNPSVPA